GKAVEAPCRPVQTKRLIVSSTSSEDETKDADERKKEISEPTVHRMRLIVSSTSSEDEVPPNEKKEEAYTYRGQPAFLVREIRGERTVGGRKEYHVYWHGYSSTEAS